jgi:hypothetical protein
VSTNVQQGAYFIGQSSNDDDRLLPEIDHQVIAGARDAADVARAEPMPEQHALHITLEDGRVGVKVPRQRVAWLVITDARG